MQRTFTTTDTHGCFKELRECLDLSGFRYDEDRLIHIGDITDRGPDSFLVVEELLKIKNLIAIRGNHDEWMLDFIKTSRHPSLNHNGVYKTILSYAQAQDMSYEDLYVNQKMSGISTNFEPRHMPKTHRDFFKNQINYYIDRENRLFVHAGYDPMELIETQHTNTLIWERDLVQGLARQLEVAGEVKNYPDVNNFKRIFVGHTPTIIFKKHHDKLSPLWLPGGVPYSEPMYMGQLVDCDTGCCFGGKLSLIDITDDDNHILYQNL